MLNIKNEISQLKLGFLIVKGVKVQKKNHQLWQEIEAECKRQAEKYKGKNLGEIEGIKAVRRLYSSVGMEPTHFRPSSEALLRRVLKGQGLYQINSVVDVNNLYSLKLLIPMGLYDLGKIKGNLTIRLGKEGEFYRGIGKDRVNAEGRIIMVDEEKICGGPTSDSMETMVTLGTEEIVLTLYAPKDYSDEEVGKFLNETVGVIVKYNGGSLITQDIVSG